MFVKERSKFSDIFFRKGKTIKLDKSIITSQKAMKSSRREFELDLFQSQSLEVFQKNSNDELRHRAFCWTYGVFVLQMHYKFVIFPLKNLMILSLRFPLKGVSGGFNKSKLLFIVDITRELVTVQCFPLYSILMALGNPR